MDAIGCPVAVRKSGIQVDNISCVGRRPDHGVEDLNQGWIIAADPAPVLTGVIVATKTGDALESDLTISSYCNSKCLAAVGLALLIPTARTISFGRDDPNSSAAGLSKYSTAAPVTPPVTTSCPHTIFGRGAPSTILSPNTTIELGACLIAALMAKNLSLLNSISGANGRTPIVMPKTARANAAETPINAIVLNFMNVGHPDCSFARNCGEVLSRSAASFIAMDRWMACDTVPRPAVAGAGVDTIVQR